EPDARERAEIIPAGYIPLMEDTKEAFITIEGDLFGGNPFLLELKLRVQDSPNSAMCVLDIVRIVQLALDRGMTGTLDLGFYFKSPPHAMDLRDSFMYVERLLV